MKLGNGKALSAEDSDDEGKFEDNGDDCFEDGGGARRRRGSFFFLELSLESLSLLHGCYGGSTQRYKAIYSFGDSLADAGNLLYDTENLTAAHNSSSLHLPYGETYFQNPTGRFSDGRLIVDFICKNKTMSPSHSSDLLICFFAYSYS
ncbi:hypothetical protein PIB30_092191 [Stylosanthes scabra]|uniref:GDSL esterase/lipase n=1 Tax=Stylosanthes scabra TaxID=79078 RepID=A0ABU6YWR0_9FABA|nr:hypothetical protein [Stylosanthes scabra]